MPPYNMTREQMLYAVSGGVLISIAACSYYLIFGKLLGNTTLIKQLLSFKTLTSDFSIKMTVLSGIIFSSALLKELYHEHFISFWPFDSRSYQAESDIGVLMVSGLLIGFGAVLSGGCTFGHGVVGIPRLNIWSILSVIIFSTTAYYTNKWNFVSKLPTEPNQKLFNLPDNMDTDYYIQFFFVIPFLLYVLSKDKSIVGLAKYIIAFCIGITSGMGMMIGGLTKRSLVLKMFTYDRHWDPTIIVFFATAIAINIIVFTFVIRKKITPVFATEALNPKGQASMGLLIGSICFGIGWGLSGLCPGPFLLLVPLKSLKVPFYWGLSLCAGVKIAELVSYFSQKMAQRKNNQPVTA